MAILHDRGAGQRVALPARCLVGRAPACDLVLTGKTVSGQHAVVQWNGAAWEVRDLGSRNGTFVNDIKVLPGEARQVFVGARICFGQLEATWELEDATGPELMAVHVATGAVRRAEGGYLALPDAQNADLSVYLDARGEWAVEQAGEMAALADRAEVATSDGERWRIHLPSVFEGTIEVSGGIVRVVDLRFRFFVTRDEEHVELVALAGERRYELQARAHHYPLLVLARRRLADEAAGVPAGEQGWIRQDELTRMLRVDDSHLNLSIHRARAQLGKLGVQDAAGLVERRSGSRQLRFGAPRIEIVAG